MRAIKDKIIAMTVSAVLAGCSGLPVKSSLEKGELKDQLVTVSDKTYIRTRGIGAAPTDDESLTKTRRLGLARNAALVAARYELLQVIKGIHVEGGLTIGKLIEKDSAIKEKADRIIHGAEEILAEFTKDDGCVVVIQLERSKVDELTSEDKKYEKKQWLTLPGIPDKESRYTPRYYRNDEKTPTRAALAGLFVPGGAQFYAKEPDLGVLYFIGISALAGTGAGLMTKANQSEPKKGNSPENESSVGNREANAVWGTVLLIAGGMLHLWSAYDGSRSVADSSFVMDSDGKSFRFMKIYRY